MSFIINPYIVAPGGPSGPPVYDSSSTANADTVNLSWSHTVASQSNRILLVFIYFWTGNGQTVSGVTYNSVAMTKLDEFDQSSRSMNIWYLLNPDTGTHTVAATGTGLSADKQATSISLYNAVQSAPTASHARASSTTPAVTVTGDTSDLFLDGVGKDAGAGTTLTVGANQTERSNFAQGNQGMATSTAPGVASESMNWTLSGSTGWVIIGVKVGGV